MFRVNIVSNPTCSCGAVLEDAEHFFFECRLYTEQRNRLSDSLNFIPVVTLDLLVNRNADLPGETKGNYQTSSVKIHKRNTSVHLTTYSKVLFSIKIMNYPVSFGANLELCSVLVLSYYC